MYIDRQLDLWWRSTCNIYIASHYIVRLKHVIYVNCISKTPLNLIKDFSSLNQDNLVSSHLLYKCGDLQLHFHNIELFLHVW